MIRRIPVRIAAWWREQHPSCRVIGVTGSLGKTTTKELTASVMLRHYNTLYSPGNLNSDEGLPLALLALNETHERAVLEMGMSAPGELRTLSAIAARTR